MTRGRGTVGVGAPLGGECPRCDHPITDYRRAVKRRGKWIHKTCAPGADE